MKNVTKLFAAALAIVLLGTALPAGAMGPDPAESAAAKYKEAVTAVKSWQYRKAISLLQDVLETDARNADALNYMGYSHRKLGDYKQALTYYQRALAIAPDHRGANEYIGEAYLELKQPDKAKAHLDRLARICGPGCEEYAELKKAFDAYMGTGKQS